MPLSKLGHQTEKETPVIAFFSTRAVFFENFDLSERRTPQLCFRHIAFVAGPEQGTNNATGKLGLSIIQIPPGTYAVSGSPFGLRRYQGWAASSLSAMLDQNSFTIRYGERVFIGEFSPDKRLSIRTQLTNISRGLERLPADLRDRGFIPADVTPRSEAETWPPICAFNF